MSWTPPSFEDTREFGAVIEEGWYDMALTNVVAKKSSNGNPMIVGTWTVDRGEFAGVSIRDWYTLGLESQIGEGKLKSIGVKTGFAWEPLTPLKNFAKQFVEQDPILRLSGKVIHRYSVEQPGGGGWKNNVKKEEWEAAKAEGLSVGINPSIVAFGVAKEEPDLEKLVATYGEEKAEEEPDEPAIPEAFDEPDDDLPF